MISLDEVDAFVGQEIREVHPFGVIDFRLRDEIEVLAHRHDGFIEPALRGVVRGVLADVPLAVHRRCVPGGLHHVADRFPIEWQILHVVHGA